LRELRVFVNLKCKQTFYNTYNKLNFQQLWLIPKKQSCSPNSHL
jgi:hypothetical protein